MKKEYTLIHPDIDGGRGRTRALIDEIIASWKTGTNEGAGEIAALCNLLTNEFELPNIYKATAEGPLGALSTEFFSFLCKAANDDHPLVQLSDMFAGLAGYSYNAFGKYQRWKIENSANHYLPGICAEVAVKFSKSDKERLPVLHHVREQSGKRKFQISLDSSKGLCSKSPGSPLNFWIYTPLIKDEALRTFCMQEK